VVRVLHRAYPALLTPPLLSFTDQFAFRPSGSTTAALITILHTITNLLTTNQFVIVIALDFSKAFDTVRHSTLLNKYSQMEIPDHTYNWLVDYFQNHSHCTKYREQTSAFREISASIIQRSAIGPASYVITVEIFVPSHRETVFASTPMIRISSSQRSMFTVE